ncbi:MAG: NAD(+)/NADH kinase [Clostridium sp.]|jgi:NAD+ kinase|uniref:NAD(+)/NADH kinase n=1 Tax=Clostridium sp. TaxID=1506 RepID=UPI0025C6A630|nr:NAD(+)/NADH kinase [Clostridium sp.]MCH3964141.1 NAD(+)/NADH kinase [Clostridium sp.]MCI1715322.1 NAD(+)/NADH kinase [Clostridium sp.]MCI1799887.1 NAD(+)/NADH kinase [Clostridium sp.]MCI1813505.1 NAD(+)/NADH kinase [Clostridium sp.]MCI1870705.1 NAD(+)/NADH kinase [Clostridium sp.]
MKNIGINVNTTKDPENKMLDFIVKTIYSINKDINIKVYRDCIGLDTEESRKLDVVIVLGGDGTILNTSGNLPESETPILGVNIGHLGFLAQVEINSIRPALINLFEGNYTIEDRTMIQCSFDNGHGMKNFHGLNDVILYKGIRNRIEKYDIFIDNEFYNVFSGDGIIICTSTGSTAYNLSAGGPIIHSSLDAFCITPMYSQFLTARTIVLNNNSHITIKMRRNNESAFISVDGQEWIDIKGPITINISKSIYKRKLIKFSNSSFFKTLRDKITFGAKECEGDIYESDKTHENS